MKNPVEIAQTWFEKANQAEDHYDRFVYLWFALNALYNEFFTGSERKAISDLIYSDDYRLNNSKINEILNIPEVEFFKNRIIRDCRGNGRDTCAYAAILKSNSYSHKKKLDNLLKILYQVRCNLFHGNKMFGRDSDDEVILHASTALRKVVESLLR